MRRIMWFSNPELLFVVPAVDWVKQRSLLSLTECMLSIVLLFNKNVTPYTLYGQRYRDTPHNY